MCPAGKRDGGSGPASAALPSSRPLPLAELEPLASLRTPWLLALDRASVASEESKIAKLRSMRFVDFHERASHGEPERAGLARLAAALTLRLDIIATERVGRRERLLDGGHERRPREEIAERAPVHVPFSGSGLEVHAARRFLAAADGVNGRRLHHLL